VWADDWTKYLSFGSVALLACIANRVLYSADLWFSGPRVTEWPFYAVHREAALRKAELVTIIGTLLAVLAWLLAGGARRTAGVLSFFLGSPAPQRTPAFDAVQGD
jgi:hypothetical protein